VIALAATAGATRSRISVVRHSRAAQLLEQAAILEDRMLTRLICDEAAASVTLVDAWKCSATTGPVARGPVKHSFGARSRQKAAQSGFAAQYRFVEDYDPSLPPVLAIRTS